MPRPARPEAILAVLCAGVVTLSGCLPDLPTHPTTRGTTSAATGSTAADPSPSPSQSPTGRPSTPPPSPGASGIPSTAATVAGVDVSRYQPTVDWAGLWATGHRFAWVKATEGTTHVSPTYAAQRSGALGVGMLVGGYHYARPAASSGAAQARHFLTYGGGWTSDGRTLPGALDLEAATTGDPCYGLNPSQLVRWVRDFSDTYRATTGRVPVIYVRADMWDRCLGADRSFGSTNPLWLYDHDGPMGPLPAGWDRPTVWQRGVDGNLDRNVFLGTEPQLRAWATSGS